MGILSVVTSVSIFLILLVAILRTPAYLVKPSVLFMLFYSLQVQIPAAINYHKHAADLNSPWTFFFITHGFSLAALVISLCFKKSLAKETFERLDRYRFTQDDRAILIALLFFVLIMYIIFAAYLEEVSFEKTGLYALLFYPDLVDSYRETSMKLLANEYIKYSFAILEKVIAPIAGSLFALYIGVLWFKKKRILSLLLLPLGILIIFPVLIYGARGPSAMVVLTMLFTIYLVFIRRLSFKFIGVSLIAVLIIPSSIMLLKTNSYEPNAIFYQMLNTTDRAIGRGYIDNYWHVKQVEQGSFYGIRGIEKLATVFGLDPIDAFNQVALKNKENGRSFGFSFLEIAPPKVKIYITKTEEQDIELGSAIYCDQVKDGCVDISLSASSNASFNIMNYAMFGIFGIFISIFFIFLMDYILYLYRYITDFMLIPAVAASIVPTLGLSFSLMTTTLLSKGFLLIPIICLVSSFFIQKVYAKPC
jgi:hypothetical protein